MNLPKQDSSPLSNQLNSSSQLGFSYSLSRPVFPVLKYSSPPEIASKSNEKAIFAI